VSFSLVLVKRSWKLVELQSRLNGEKIAVLEDQLETIFLEKFVIFLDI